MTTSNLEQALEPPHAKHELLRVEHAWPEWSRVKHEQLRVEYKWKRLPQLITSKGRAKTFKLKLKYYQKSVLNAEDSETYCFVFGSSCLWYE